MSWAPSLFICWKNSPHHSGFFLLFKARWFLTENKPDEFSHLSCQKMMSRGAALSKTPWHSKGQEINQLCSQSEEQTFEVRSFPRTRATPINVMGVPGICQERNQYLLYSSSPREKKTRCNMLAYVHPYSKLLLHKVAPERSPQRTKNVLTTLVNDDGCSKTLGKYGLFSWATFASSGASLCL